MRWKIVPVDCLAIQLVCEVQEQLCQILCVLNPIRAWTVVLFLVTIQFYLQAQVLDLEIIGAPLYRVPLEQQRTHHRLQRLTVLRQVRELIDAGHIYTDADLLWRFLTSRPFACCLRWFRCRAHIAARASASSCRSHPGSSPTHWRATPPTPLLPSCAAA